MHEEIAAKFLKSNFKDSQVSWFHFMYNLPILNSQFMFVMLSRIYNYMILKIKPEQKKLFYFLSQYNLFLDEYSFNYWCQKITLNVEGVGVCLLTYGRTTHFFF